jgi:3-dehydroquinate dehydratase II
VHISNVHKRGIPPSLLRLAARRRRIAGCGAQGYLLGLRRIAKLIDEKKT